MFQALLSLLPLLLPPTAFWALITSCCVLPGLPTVEAVSSVLAMPRTSPVVLMLKTGVNGVTTPGVIRVTSSSRRSLVLRGRQARGRRGSRGAGDRNQRRDSARRRWCKPMGTVSPSDERDLTTEDTGREKTPGEDVMAGSQLDEPACPGALVAVFVDNARRSS
jgi:hypothetical protein